MIIVVILMRQLIFIELLLLARLCAEKLLAHHPICSSQLAWEVDTALYLFTGEDVRCREIR